MSQKFSNLREYYRINYIAPDQPTLEHGKMRYLVLDLSEGGVRFGTARAGQQILFSVGEILEGRIFFSGNRGIVSIRGEVIRAGKHDVALRLIENGCVPLARIMEEQMFLIRKGKL